MTPTPSHADAEGSRHRPSTAAVLLVDDRPENLLAFAAALEPLALEVVSASTPVEALRLATAREFAVILLDVQMPGMDGYEVARRIKALARPRLTPIIFVTALDRDRRRVHTGYESGAVDYLFKPLDPDELRAKVQAFARLHDEREAERWWQRRRYADLEEAADLAREAAALENGRRAAELLERIGDAYLALDHEFRIVGVNPAAERLLAKSRESLLGRSHWEAFPASATNDAGRAYRRVAAERIEQHLTQHYTAEGYDLHVEIAAYPAEDGAVAIFLRDVLERVRAEAALRSATAELAQRTAVAEAAQRAAEEANRVKSEFLAVMSHELRTPLNAIAGYAQLIELEVHGPVTPEQRHALERIQRSQRHLLGLIDDVLNFAKLEAGYVEYDLADVPVRAAIDALEPLVTPQLEARRLRLERGDCVGDLAVRADPDKLRQILVNLLSNAIKFTNAGGAVAIRCEAGAPGTVRLVVSDTGLGIPADRLEQIFAPFVQVERRLNAPQEGTGLGLAISRDLARGMGGDLTVESTMGAGSTFIVTLPRA